MKGWRIVNADKNNENYKEHDALFYSQKYTDSDILIKEAHEIILSLNDDQLRLLMERMGYIGEKAV